MVFYGCLWLPLMSPGRRDGVVASAAHITKIDIDLHSKDERNCPYLSPVLSIFSVSSYKLLIESLDLSLDICPVNGWTTSIKMLYPPPESPSEGLTPPPGWSLRTESQDVFSD